jgi:carboxyl-terminal processing protease
MRIGRHRLALIVLSFLVLAFTLVGRLVGDEGQREQTYADLATFTEVLHLVDTSYVDAVAEEDLMAGAFRGMLASLDPWSGWLSPEEAAALQDDGAARVEAGLETTKRSGYAWVIRVHPGSPAEKAGVKVGDYIRSIEGRSTREMSFMQTRRALSGPPDARLGLNLFGDQEGREAELVLVPWQVEPLTSRLTPEGILVVTLRVVSSEAVVALQGLLQSPPTGTRQVMLDLRNLVNGDEADAVALADLFMNDGAIVEVEEKGKEPRQVEARSGRVWDGPLALLVNGLSAGAAEIVAAALQRSGRAEILGESTFGDAAVQRLIRLPDRSALILSVGRYLAPGGATWHLDGLEPDVAIESGASDAEGEDEDEDREPESPDPAAGGDDDLQLDRALEYLTSRGEAEKAA